METISKIKAAELLGVSRKSIHRWINNGFLVLIENQLNIDDILKLKNEKFVGFKKFVWDYDFFSLKNVATTYWSGFMMGDGNIRKYQKSNSYQINLTISQNDKSHLEKFCESINLNKDKIKQIKGKDIKFGEKIIKSGPQVSVRISDLRLQDDLIKWGVIPDKTHNFIEPTFDLKFLGHYLRGWIDADGSIRRKSSQHVNSGPQIQLTGNPNTINWLYSNLKIFLPEIHITNSIQVNNRVLYISGYKNCNKLYNFCDGSNVLRLDRKWSMLDFLQTFQST